MNKLIDNLQFKVYTDILKKSDKGGKHLIRGYASTAALDRQNEVISIEALRQAANHLLENHTVFYEHEHQKFPVGKVIETGIDDKGLEVVVEISQTADQLWTLIEEEILDSFSIGGRVTSSEEKIGEDKKPYNEITGIELFEVSVVGLPANPEAKFELVNKSFSMAITDEIKKRKEGSEMKKEKESISGSIKVDGTSDIVKIVEPEAEKTEKKDKAKKEAKVEKTEIPKDEVKKETPVEKKEKTEVEEKEEVAPEAKKSKETTKDDKTTKEKPEEKKEDAQKKDLERYEAEDKAKASEKPKEEKETTEKSQEAKPEEIVEKKTEKEVVEGEKVEEQKEVVEDTKEIEIKEEKVAEAKVEPVESAKVEEKVTIDTSDTTTNVDKTDDTTSDDTSTIQINLLPDKKVDKAKPEVKEEKCEECVTVEEKPTEEKVEEKPETKTDDSIVTDEEFEKLVVEDISKPYPNEHAARIREPNEFQEGSFRSKPIAEGIRIIIGRLIGEETATVQSYRFHVDHFTAEEAKQWLKDHEIDYIKFEPATQEATAQPEEKEEVKAEIREVRVLTEEKVLELFNQLKDSINALGEKINAIEEKASKVEEVKPKVEEKKEEPKVEKNAEEKPQRKSFIADAPYANDKKDKEKKEKDKNKTTDKGWSKIIYGNR